MHYALLHLFGRHRRDANDLPICEVYAFDSSADRIHWLEEGPGLADESGYRESVETSHPTVQALLREDSMFPGDLTWLD